MDEYEEGQFGQVAHMVGVLSKCHGENKTKKTKTKSKMKHSMVILHRYKMSSQIVKNYNAETHMILTY